MLRTRRAQGLRRRTAQRAHRRPAVRVLQRPRRARRTRTRSRSRRGPVDPADYLVVESRDRRPRSRSTNTCAANLLGIVQPGRLRRRVARRRAARVRGRGPAPAARPRGGRAPDARGVGPRGRPARRRRSRTSTRSPTPVIMAVGGGAGGLGRHVAAHARARVRGAAGRRGDLVDRRRAVARARARASARVVDPTAADVDALVAEVELEAVVGRRRSRLARGPGRVRRRPQGAARGRHRIDRARGRRGPGPAPADAPDDRGARPRSTAATRAASSGVFWVAEGDGPGRGPRPLRRRRRRGDRRGRAPRTGAGASGLRDAVAKAVERRTRTVGSDAGDPVGVGRARRCGSPSSRAGTSSTPRWRSPDRMRMRQSSWDGSSAVALYVPAGRRRRNLDPRAGRRARRRAGASAAIVGRVTAPTRRRQGVRRCRTRRREVDRAHPERPRSSTEKQLAGLERVPRRWHRRPVAGRRARLRCGRARRRRRGSARRNARRRWPRSTRSWPRRARRSIARAAYPRSSSTRRRAATASTSCSALRSG